MVQCFVPRSNEHLDSQKDLFFCMLYRKTNSMTWFPFNTIRTLYSVKMVSKFYITDTNCIDVNFNQRILESRINAGIRLLEIWTSTLLMSRGNWKCSTVWPVDTIFSFLPRQTSSFCCCLRPFGKKSVLLILDHLKLTNTDRNIKKRKRKKRGSLHNLVSLSWKLTDGKSSPIVK